MVNQIATNFENMANGLGLSIKILRPSQTARKACGATNGLIGIALIGAGTILKKLSLFVLGALGMAGATLLLLDK